MEPTFIVPSVGVTETVVTALRMTRVIGISMPPLWNVVSTAPISPLPWEALSPTWSLSVPLGSPSRTGSASPVEVSAVIDFTGLPAASVHGDRVEGPGRPVFGPGEGGGHEAEGERARAPRVAAAPPAAATNERHCGKKG